MGLFSGIKKATKKIFKGIKKVFKKVGKWVGKILNSKWGKALMIASAVFTGGMALAAGFQGFAAQSGSLLTKFVTGAKDFMGALVKPISTAKEGLAGNSLAGSVRAANAAESAANSANAAAGVLEGTKDVAGAAGGAAEGVVANPEAISSGEQLMSGGANALGKAPPAINPTVTVGKEALKEAPKGFLSRAAHGAYELAKTSGGGQIIAGAIRGYGEGAAAEEMAKQARYANEQWTPEHNQRGLDRLRAAVRSPNVPSGYLQRAMNSANAIPNYTPRVTLRPTGG